MSEHHIEESWLFKEEGKNVWWLMYWNDAARGNISKCSDAVVCPRPQLSYPWLPTQWAGKSAKVEKWSSILIVLAAQPLTWLDVILFGKPPKNKLAKLREGWRLQNWWIFGKVPNGLWPPPSFSENHIADFATKLWQKCVCSLWRDCYNIKVLYDPISHEMHVVQQFNMVIGWKHTLKRPSNYPILPSACPSVTQKVSRFSGRDPLSMPTWSG